MTRVLSLVLLFTCVSLAQVHYCIQVVSSPILRDVERRYERLKDLPNTRVERIGGLYTLRVGVFENLREAVSYLNMLRSEARLGRGAFVRRCANKPERVVKGSVGEPTKDLYRLLIVALLGAQKLETALKVARRGTQMFPEDPYWWKLYGELLSWTGKVKEAIDPLIKAYELSGDKKALREAFNIAVAIGRYDIAKKYMNVLELSEEEKIHIYTGMGDVRSLIELLKKRDDKASILRLAELLLAVGDREGVLKATEKFEKLYGRNEKISLLRAKALLARKDFKGAINSLLPHLKEGTRNTEILSLIAMIGFMLGDKDTSLRASLRLIEMGKGEEIDYERVSILLARRDPERAVETALEGWRRFKKDRFLRRALHVAYINEMWDRLLALIGKYYGKEAEEDRDIFTYKMTALHKLGKTEEVIKTIGRRLQVDPNPQLLSYYLYLLMESRKAKELENALRRYRSYERDPSSAPAFVSALLYLNRGKRALTLYHRSGLKDPLLLSYILDVLGEGDRARSIRLKEFRKREILIRKKGDSIKNPRIITDYLTLAQEFLPAPRYRRLLYRFKDRIPAEIWRELALTHSFSTGSTERVRFLSRIKGYPLKPWMSLSLALEESNAVSILALDRRFGNSLPPADRSRGLSLAGMDDRAFETAFKGFEENPRYQGLYLSLRDLSMKLGFRSTLEGGYMSRRGYKEVWGGFSVVAKGIGGGDLDVSVKSYKPIEGDRNLVGRTPEGRYINIKFSREADLWSFSAGAGEWKRTRPNVTLSASFEVKPLKFLSVGLSASRNSLSEETLYLYLGGVKDYVRGRLSSFLGDRFVVSGEYEMSNFYSAGRDNIGIGRLATLDLSYQIRYSYPNLRANLYLQRGRFVPSKYGEDLDGVVPAEGFEIIPRDYTSAGGSLSFGYENRDRYTRVWRPFGTLLAGYNSRYGRLLGLSVGIGGGLLDKDNLSLEISVNENVGATQETILRAVVLYHRWF